MANTHLKAIYTLTISLLASQNFVFAANDVQGSSAPPAIGNFALPGSQQPGPYVSFGQDIIGQGQTQLIASPGYYASTDTKRENLISYGIFGITDSVALIMSLPYFINQDIKTQKNGHIQSQGWGDFQVQGEYAFYTFQDEHYSDNATILAGVKFPTAKFIAAPTKGAGSEGYFVGTSFQRTAVQWLAYANMGGFFTTFNERYKPGDQLMYQMGVGHNLHSIPGQSIFSVLFEFNGTYTGRTNWRKTGMAKNSGGHVLAFTPSIFYSTPRWIFQAGPTIFVTQHLLGSQSQSRYAASVFLTYTLG